MNAAESASAEIPGWQQAIRATCAHPTGAPRTPLEATLADIWATLLDLDEVGVHDPFPALGGSSLLAMRLVTRVLGTLQVDVPGRALLEAFTVAEMALVVTQHLAGLLDPAETLRLLSEADESPTKVGDQPRAGGARA